MSKKRKRGAHFKTLSSNSTYLLGRVISDLKVGSLCKQDFVEIPYSNYVQKFIYFLYRRGLITRFFVDELDSKKIICIVLKYFKNSGFLQNIVIFSKPSKTIFYSYKKIVFLKIKTSVFTGGLAIFSTNLGILDAEMCIRSRIGGLYICFVPFMLLLYLLDKIYWYIKCETNQSHFLFRIIPFLQHQVFLLVCAIILFF